MEEINLKIKNSNSVIQQTLITGMARLVAGQKQFAEEFGLHLNRVFPQLDELCQSTNIFQLLQNWMQSENQSDSDKLHKLFDAFVKHQLALMGALDGIALQTLDAVTPVSASSKSIKAWWRDVKFKKKHEQLENFKSNHQLRYQYLITPGFVNAYMKQRENLGDAHHE